MTRYLPSLQRLALGLGMPSIDASSGVDALLPYLELMRSEGAVVVLKLDGQRGPADTPPYTAVVSAGKLGDDFLRIDAASLADAAAHVIVNHARLLGLLECPRKRRDVMLMKPDAVKSSQDAIRFLRVLKEEIENRPSEWAHTSLTEYLDAMAAWLEDAAGREQAAYVAPLDEKSWQAFADMLIAPKYYE